MGGSLFLATPCILKYFPLFFKSKCSCSKPNHRKLRSYFNGRRNDNLDRNLNFLNKAVGRSIIILCGGGGVIFKYSCSAQLISSEIEIKILKSIVFIVPEQEYTSTRNTCMQQPLALPTQELYFPNMKHFEDCCHFYHFRIFLKMFMYKK